MQVIGGQPIVVERAMYAQDGSTHWGAAGHRAAGVTQPSTVWHLADGYVGGLFDTYLLLANPHETAATVTVEALGDGGVLASQELAIAPHSRVTLHAGDLGLTGGPVAFSVRSTNGQPIVAERAMWWRAAPGQPWVEAHASAGATADATHWGLADLRVGGTRRETQYLFVQNVAGVTATVDLTVFVDGARVSRTYLVAPASRLTIDLGVDVTEARDRASSAILRSSSPVTVEASRYWDADGVRWSAGVNLRATALP